METLMRATGVLMKEHRAIEVMLRVLEAISSRAEADEPLEQEDLDAIVEFLQVFADKCHHGKEEDLLFPAMEAAGIPREGGPIGVMLAEHSEGRNIVKRLAAAVDGYKAKRGGAAAEIASAARDYVRLLSQHIQKEDGILYPMANARMSGDKEAELVEAFKEVERERIGPGKHEEFHALLHRLESVYLRG